MKAQIMVTGKTHDKTSLVKFSVESPKRVAQSSVVSQSEVKKSSEDRVIGLPHDTTKRV